MLSIQLSNSPFNCVLSCHSRRWNRKNDVIMIVQTHKLNKCNVKYAHYVLSLCICNLQGKVELNSKFEH